jgi:hypothetical protein
MHAGPRRLLAVTLALQVALPLWSFPVAFGGMVADLPEGWSEFSSSEGVFAAADGDLVPGTAVFQVSWKEAAAYPSAAEMVDAVVRRLGSTGEVSGLSLDGRPAALAEVSFTAGQAPVRGYLLCIDSPRADVAVLAYADAAAYDAQIDFLLSCMDSFRLSADALREPGPISQFLSVYPRSVASRAVGFGDGSVPVRADAEELDAMQAVIEREARMLVAYTDDPARDEAWRRYYRVIYRDSYPRLEETAHAIGQLAGGSASSSAATATAVLSWLQGFGYARTGSLSDLLSPLSAVGTRSGDCDARALAFLIIMSHLGVDGDLLVSSVYSHAIAAVAVDAPGIAFMEEGRRFVTAETTKKTSLGWIDEGQRDLAKWVIVRFDE